MNRELFKNYFSFQRPGAMLKIVYNTNDKQQSNDLVNMTKSGSSDLKNEIKKMSAEEKENEKLNKIIDIVEKFLEFNDRI